MAEREYVAVYVARDTNEILREVFRGSLRQCVEWAARNPLGSADVCSVRPDGSRGRLISWVAK